MTLATADAEAVVVLPAAIDLRRTLAPLAHGSGDPTIQLRAAEAWLAYRTADGPAALHTRLLAPDRLQARAWGIGAAAALRAVPRLVGCDDDPSALVARHPLVRELQRRFAGARLPRTRRVFDALLPAIIEQKVTGTEARRAYRRLVRRYGEPAPGPFRLWLVPSPALLARLPYHAFHPLGIERRRAEVIRRAAAVAPRLEAARSAAEAGHRLTAVTGIGPWTVAEVLRVAWGDPDAVSVGDYHLPHLVAWTLAREARADDARMLELLEPYRGQRGRVQLLLEAGGVSPPRFGPRMTPRDIAAL